MELPIHHFGYITRRMERTIEIYERLGFKQIGETVTDPVQKNRIQFLESPKERLKIELIEPLEDSTMKNWPEGLQHICFDASQVPDFEAWFHMQKLGRIYMKNVPAPALGGRTVCFACLTDRTFAEFILK